ESVKSIVGVLRSHEDLSHIDLVPAVRAAIALPLPLARHFGSRRVVMVAGAAIAMAAFALLWIVPSRSEHALDDGYRAKGGAARIEAERWIGLGVYQTSADDSFHRVERRVAAGRPLAFTYTNMGPAPFRYLIVVGIDARGERLWFYPAVDGDPTQSQATAIP